MTDLRTQVVEAMVKADHGPCDACREPTDACYRLAARRLDAALGVLGEQGETWRRAALDLKSFPTINFPMFNELPERLLAVLRDSGKETPDG